MADYKRVVSYIYLYNHQLKGNNVGFARMETRNHQCKLTIHVRVPNLEEQTVKAYMYCWYGEQMHGVLLGEVHIKNGTGDFHLVTDPDNVCESKYVLEEMSGIILYLSDNMFLGTEWDDRSITFNTIEIDQVKTKEKEIANSAKKSSEQSAVTKEKETKNPYISIPGVAVEAVEQKNTKITGKGDTSWQQICNDQQSRMERPQQKEFELPSKEIEESLQYESSSLSKETAEAELVMSMETEESTEEVGNQEEEELEETIEETPEETNSTDNPFPLNQERMDSLDRQAKALFDTMMMTNFFDKKDSADVMKSMEVNPSVVISPKSAIECFTAFKSCESNEEYDEIQSDIVTLKSQVAHLERISEEWLIKLARIEEEREARAREKERLEAKLRESFNIDTDVYSEEEDSEELSQQSITMEQEKSTLQVSAVVTRIFAKYPKIEPFGEDSDVIDCVRIEPQDIGIFPMENWILANNSFLLHGYYSYRHLIFAMCDQNGTAEFFLGVPGIGHSRESFMAKMFGFNSFRQISAEEKEESNEEFGYWCMPIKMPL